MTIPVNEPVLDGRELDYVSEAVKSGWISSAGPCLDEFEAKWAAYCGRRHGIAVSSGTAALLGAVAALDLEPGDEVIMPCFTIISCALAIIQAGATPVLVDADPITWTLDVEQAAGKITPRTRAIMVVHIYGHPADMAAIEALAGKHGLAIIEDAAEAHGAECRMGNGEWRRAGSFGALSIFSFYANKIVTTGEGGMVLTDDPALAERVRGYRNLFFGERNRFTHTELGFNFRLTNLQAALGLAQTERIDELVERKRWMGREYTARLADCAGIQLPAEAPWARNVYWMYGLLTTEQSGLDGAALARALDERGIQTRPFFTGMHRQPALRERGLFAGETYPVTERLARMGLYLPSGLALSEDQLETVAKAVRDIVG